MEIRSGDQTAFRLVYNEVFPVIMKVAFHITYSTEAAEDICQDAFIKFFDKDMVFPSMDDATYWLIRVSKNLALNYVKRKAREAASIDKIKRAPEGVNPFRGGETELLLKETQLAVRQAIAKLPKIYRTVIVLREYADLDYKAIAKVLKTSESNIKVRMHRARKELEQMLNREEGNVPR